jgi:drug/metabolite transporter (DMT)-like permease
MTEQKKWIISLILLAWVFATMWIFARYLDLSFELFEQTYLRIGVAFALSCVFFYKKVRFTRYLSTSWKDIFLLCCRAVFLYLGVVCITQWVIEAKFANASLIATLPLMPIFGYIILGETLSMRTLSWIIVWFIGSLIITFQPDFSLWRWELFALASLIFFDISYVMRKMHSNYLNNYETTTFMFFVGALFLFITSFLMWETFISMNDFNGIILFVIVVAWFFNVLNLFLTNYWFDKVKVAIAGNILTLEIVFALIYWLFLYREIPILREIIWGSIILLSIYMVNKTENII